MTVAKELSLTGEEYMWIMTSIVLSTYTSASEGNHKVLPYESPNTRKMEFLPGMLALYTEMTRNAVLARIDRHIAPLIINVLSKLTNHPAIKQWKINGSTRYETARDSSKCIKLFKDIQRSVHSFPEIHKLIALQSTVYIHNIVNYFRLLIDEFKRAPSIFQKDGLSLAGNYSLYNFQMPKKEWKRVGEYINGSLSIADLQWPANRSKPPPGNQANYSDPNNYRCCSGFYIDIFNALKERLKFEYELYQVPDKTWGARDPVSNEWNGLIAELVKHRADLALTSLKVTTERNSAVDFSVPLMETGIALIVAMRPGAISTTAFLKPYDYRIWILILLVSLHGVAISVYSFDYCQKIYTDIRKHKITKDKRLLLNYFVEIVRPTHKAAFMITKDVYFELTGINDVRLSNPWTMKPAFQFGTVINGSTDEVVRTNHKQIYSYMKPFMKRNVSDGIKALKLGSLHAFLYDAVVLDYLSGQDNECKLRVVGNWYAMTGYGIGFPKKSKFKDMIDKQIIALHDSGEIERLRRFWFTGACKTNDDHQSQSSSQALGTRNFISAFLLLSAGTALATIILLCEHGYSSFLSSKKSKFLKSKFQYQPSITRTSIESANEYQPMINSQMNDNDRFQTMKKRESFLLTKISVLEQQIKELEKRNQSDMQLQHSMSNYIQSSSNVKLKPKLEIENDEKQLLLQSSFIDSFQTTNANNNSKISSDNTYLVLPVLYTHDPLTSFEIVRTPQQMITSESTTLRPVSTIYSEDLPSNRTSNESFTSHNIEPMIPRITVYESAV
ncbi:unnamed protein product [Didymodactylos carnosus]|uniref:Uncharacterized protein n=1 Tax=Didymodactylos carnosus TaxID=1234261 RepID=A0A814F5C4_9BILA|nr:unnamed protein product [Didymodactylos carnosus]CAF0990016.1 unnamed protein product [Didymodactylos carnosus]CAF3751072.1 unnamed protein product [Didymodactylos carnosus]CAF3760126.1 unnamed protein product [Didymodactylos carnosus]